MSLFSVTVIANHWIKQESYTVFVHRPGKWMERFWNRKHSHLNNINNFRHTLVMINEYGHNNFSCRRFLRVFNEGRYNVVGREQGRDRMDCDCSGRESVGGDFCHYGRQYCSSNAFRVFVLK